MEGANFIDYIKDDDYSWMAVITPYRFLKFSLLMASAALDEDHETDMLKSRFHSIHHLCRIPRCPPMLLRLLQSAGYNELFGFDGNAFTFDENGMLPIHYAVQSPPVSYKFVPSYLQATDHKSLVQILLEENPNGVKVADDQGRLPLHYALDSGRLLEKDVLALVRLYPDSLRIRDPKTGLLPFMLVATNTSRTSVYTDMVLSSAFIGDSEQELLQSCLRNDFEKLKRVISRSPVRYQAQWKRDHVSMSFLLLLLYPDVIPCQAKMPVIQQSCN
ncbi:unnamed protein product [Pseudo-nitzschia multistriata]|uniref:Uncharacterized protein n=1 Tax=Pseudo-nitzschia multistriata TaxID=183589 RepID=A0A448ZN17_9STRA|nr:unnamed protein product [Pseudo-nitzschia multistriata]